MIKAAAGLGVSALLITVIAGIRPCYGKPVVSRTPERERKNSAAGEARKPLSRLKDIVPLPTQMP